MKKRNGFTLIELLIVVAIIAILAAIAIPNFLAAQVRAKVSRTKEDMRSMATALEAYRVDNSWYPMDVYDKFYNTPGPVPWATDIRNFIPLTTPIAYMTSVPKDIFAITTYEDESIPWYQADYFNYMAYQPWYDGSQIDNAYGPNGFTSPDGPIYVWSIVSWGPSEQIDLPGIWYYPITCAYDPTNGTVSMGNIIRYGP